MTTVRSWSKPPSRWTVRRNGTSRPARATWAYSTLRLVFASVLVAVTVRDRTPRSPMAPAPTMTASMAMKARRIHTIRAPTCGSVEISAVVLVDSSSGTGDGTTPPPPLAVGSATSATCWRQRRGLLRRGRTSLVLARSGGVWVGRSTPARRFAMDVTRLLEADHRQVEELFEQIEKAQGVERRPLVDELARSVRGHMELEEAVVYPAMKPVTGDEAVE